MSNALSTKTKTQTVFTRADLNVNARNLLFRIQEYLNKFDAWEPRFKPRWKMEPAGEALLLHREIDRLNAQRYEHEQAVIDVDDGNDDVVVGGAK
ncbi:hypothetical protein A6M27_07665 [Acidithiobacillus thiooxidans]|uniref:Uncharacterized protein n=1 Tax=Acidithiobacillus thiooxidans TaxID=930 RepID=A0A1C2JJJ2_ACITH|nr:hypothetical protein [Acidithiobacillus thiooxidans]OCX69560.1 hypothetical protein A6O24_18245 [Acidithiobacillus thiooxidans]OCX70381.1 hypothetical protein A6P07_14575 [Acidithiobacillus thiooxidans]OCX81467.1 hypothetical protein A6O26_13200 [Acidithiobacillus thiooxidans]OCX88438.1 hypothetical protein A6M27_07665 [Acidithiobacillus thiooxidans]OFC40829.1 hypothetical protein BAE47_19285 [Acidithiobacillus thiooxidans]